MPEFVQRRHDSLVSLSRPRELVVVCAPMRSNVNLSRIARAAGCCGAARLICCGNARLAEKITRDALTTLSLEVHRTLEPVLGRLHQQDYHLVGLEQTTGSQCLFDFRFPRRTALVVGNERLGIVPEVLNQLEATVEIPVYGKPDSHNVATATAMALYEYCRQFPTG